MRLIAIAEELRAENDGISEPDRDEATGALRALWDLLRDDDVPALFEMREPSDAARAGHDPVNAMPGAPTSVSRRGSSPSAGPPPPAI